jgi:hypothetical protein
MWRTYISRTILRLFFWACRLLDMRDHEQLTPFKADEGHRVPRDQSGPSSSGTTRWGTVKGGRQLHLCHSHGPFRRWQLREDGSNQTSTDLRVGNHGLGQPTFGKSSRPSA